MGTDQEPSLEEVTINQYIHRTKWPRFIALSAAVHLVVLLATPFFSKHQIRNIPKQPISVTLYQEPIIFDPTFELGQETELTIPEQKLEQRVSEELPEARSLLLGIDESSGERIGDFYSIFIEYMKGSILEPVKARYNESMEKIADANNRLYQRFIGQPFERWLTKFLKEIFEEIYKNENFSWEKGPEISDEERYRAMDKEVIAIAQAADELAKKVKLQSLKEDEKYAGMVDVLLNKKDISELYIETYRLGERNKISYSDFFEEYVEVHLTLGRIYEPHRHKQISPILESNLNMREIIGMDVMFYEDGTFEITRLEPLPGFNDKDGLVLRYYQERLANIPNNFVPPRKAGLPPHIGHYVVLNTQKDQKVESPTPLISK